MYIKTFSYQFSFEPLGECEGGLRQARGFSVKKLSRLAGQVYLSGCQLMVSTDNGNDGGGGGGDYGGGGDGGGCQASAAQPGLRLQREMWRGSSAP